jgi:general stress protein 26
MTTARTTAPTATAARFPADYGQTPATRADLLGWNEVAERIVGARNYWLATSRADGSPHLRPVDGVFVENVLCFGGSPQTRWVQHLRHQPAISASLPDDDHAVILEGRAELVEDPADPAATAQPAANRAKYPQYFSGDEQTEFQPFWCLRPARVYAWSLSGFPAKATRFDFG